MKTFNILAEAREYAQEIYGAVFLQRGNYMLVVPETSDEVQNLFDQGYRLADEKEAERWT